MFPTASASPEALAPRHKQQAGKSVGRAVTASPTAQLLPLLMGHGTDMDRTSQQAAPTKAILSKTIWWLLAKALSHGSESDQFRVAGKPTLARPCCLAGLGDA